MDDPRGFSRDLSSTPPTAIDTSPTGPMRLAHRFRVPPSWRGRVGYVLAGTFVGAMLLLSFAVGRSDAAGAASPDALTDNVVRLHAGEVRNDCWDGYKKVGAARLTVALEVGVDGKIRYAAASGETPAMRACLEDHVRAWEFLPQAEAQTMALPFEVDRR